MELIKLIEFAQHIFRSRKDNKISMYLFVLTKRDVIKKWNTRERVHSRCRRPLTFYQNNSILYLHNITRFNLVCKCGCSIECGMRMGPVHESLEFFASVGANETIRGSKPQIGANGNNVSGGRTHSRDSYFFFLRYVRGLSKRLMHFLGSGLIDRQLATCHVNNI